MAEAKHPVLEEASSNHESSHIKLNMSYKEISNQDNGCITLPRKFYREAIIYILDHFHAMSVTYQASVCIALFRVIELSTLLSSLQPDR
jgi:hypothetical protein